MKWAINRDDGGQVLVQVALMIFVLLLFVGLAVDVGNVYGERRHMQNAADAGALAGAREICFGDPPDPIGQAEHYAIDQNGAGEADVAIIADYTVHVVARVAAETYFIRLIPGLETIDVSAEAEATCGCSSSGCGFWPIAIQEETWLVDGSGCGQGFLIWDDLNVECWNETEWSEDPTQPNYQDPKDYYDCHGFDTGFIPGESRAWVDFSAKIPSEADDPCDQPGCGNAELRDRIERTDCHSFLELGCIAGDSGVKADSWKTAGEDEQIGRVVRIPVYEYTGCVMEHDPGNTCGSDRFYVTSFACVRIKGSYYIYRKEGPPKRVRVIEAELVCDGDPEYEASCATACGGPTGPGTPGCILAVGLTR